MIALNFNNLAELCCIFKLVLFSLAYITLFVILNSYMGNITNKKLIS